MQLKSDFKLKLYPNGEVTLGWVPAKRYEQEFEIDKNLGRNGATWWGGNEELRRFAEREVIKEERPSTLDLTLPSNSHRRGYNGITGYGKKLVRNAAYLLQKRYGKNRLSFLTLTLPSMSLEDEKLLASQWSRVVRVFGQRLKRLLQGRSLPGNYIGVTEIQEERLNSGKGLGLHLHIVFVGRPSARSGWSVRPVEFRTAWCSVLSTVLGKNVYSAYCENVKSVYASAEGYLGKYMSKGVLAVEALRSKYGDDAVPTAWYMATSEMRRAVKSRVRVGWDRDLRVMENLGILASTGAIERVSLKFLDIDGKEFLIGVAFRVPCDNISMLHTDFRRFMNGRAKHATRF